MGYSLPEALVRLTRSSMSRAVLAILTIAGSSPIVAQGTTGVVAAGDVTSAHPKSEATAQRWSLFIPGSGHLYAGEQGRGIALFSTAALGVGLFAVSLEHDEGCDGDVCSVRASNPAGIAAGAAVALGAWAYGVIDSRRAARRHNTRHGVGILGPGRLAPFVASSSRGARVGISILGAR
jgi:hypothetical protein